MSSAHQDRESLGERVGVGERNQQAGAAAAGEQGPRLVIKLDDRFAFGAVEDADAGQREFIKTGITPQEWDNMFGDDE
mgnify:CR=1 FL=1